MKLDVTFAENAATFPVCFENLYVIKGDPDAPTYQTETWTLTMEDGTEVQKQVVVV